MSFSTLGLHPDIVRGVKTLGFTTPTPVQRDTIPAALEGKDLLACAMTGSGKTAAFLLPIIHRVMTKNRGTTRALILTPTRELAAQILEDLRELAVHTPVTGAAIFGGVGMAPQEHAFRSGVDVLIATPGRLLDHFRQSYAKLDALEVLVLDEADRMLDMGFLPDIKRVLRHVPQKRQTFFFSATMPPVIGALAQEILTKPVKINVERQATPAVGITQAVYPVAQTLKATLLLNLLRRGDIESVLVFTRTKHRSNRLAEYLNKNGITAERIHGNRSQPQRTKALAGFKSGSYKVLVATDIAARGIDIHQLGHVINFDVPALPEDYIHRVGRTARAEATGDAYTFVAPDEEEDMRTIERVVGKRFPRITLPDFDYTARVAEAPAMPAGGRQQGRGHAQGRGNSRGGGGRSSSGTPTKSAHGAKTSGSSTRGRRPSPSSRPVADSGPYATTANETSTRGGQSSRRPRRPQ